MSETNTETVDIESVGKFSLMHVAASLPGYLTLWASQGLFSGEIPNHEPVDVLLMFGLALVFSFIVTLPTFFISSKLTYKIRGYDISPFTTALIIPLFAFLALYVSDPYKSVWGTLNNTNIEQALSFYFLTAGFALVMIVCMVAASTVWKRPSKPTLPQALVVIILLISLPVGISAAFATPADTTYSPTSDNSQWATTATDADFVSGEALDCEGKVDHKRIMGIGTYTAAGEITGTDNLRVSRARERRIDGNETRAAPHKYYIRVYDDGKRVGLFQKVKVLSQSFDGPINANVDTRSSTYANTLIFKDNATKAGLLIEWTDDSGRLHRQMATVCEPEL